MKGKQLHKPKEVQLLSFFKLQKTVQKSDTSRAKCVIDVRGQGRMTS